ncbi:hypothetical protein Lesp02_22350 [Lentzea sp. NBRC 105346]|uniref:DUF998 domain-containing protein n=1 Tax=Lentzea sp. NBRC 105346 TaxID=3032205 RepID=UPI0024A3C3CA|nr:DUF998 domain-containing protein [Lentzea sp. NBRC 105346]GLZ30045.1 hypothetical protein Lesp02_22350 [Lentzea sp. NBRC 105346]
MNARLIAGAVAGPLYLTVAYAQAFTREGFDLTKHPFSMLSLGDLGWIQIANFVVSGLLFVVAATAVREKSRWGGRLIGLLGVGMIAGGVFTADPALGFPLGTPDGVPASISWHGMLHAAAFGVAMIGWIGACFVLARRLGGVWAVLSAVTGVILIVPMAFLGNPGGTLVLYAAATIGWLWTSAVSVRLSTV